jgi:hypothetical protein
MYLAIFPSEGTLMSSNQKKKNVLPQKFATTIDNQLIFKIASILFLYRLL